MKTLNIKILKEQRSEKAERFLKSFNQSRSDLSKITDTGIRNMTGLLRDLQGEVRSRLEFFTPNDPNAPFLVRILPEMTTEIDSAVSEFVRRSQADVNIRMADAFDAGSAVTSNALSRVGLSIARPSVSTELLRSLSALTDDIISSSGTQLGLDIIRKVRISATGLTPASKTISEITQLMKSQARIGGVSRRIGFGFQAETIVRTEVGRVFSNAQQIASEEMEESIPTLRKRWVTTFGERRGHKIVEDKYNEGGPIGPIKVKQRFEVTDFSRTGTSTFFTLGRGRRQRVVKTDSFSRSGTSKTDRMLFPRDPAGSAGNVINCTCVILDVIPELDEAIERAKGVVDVAPEVKPEPAPDFKDLPLEEAEKKFNPIARKKANAVIRKAKRFDKRIGQMEKREAIIISQANSDLRKSYDFPRGSKEREVLAMKAKNSYNKSTRLASENLKVRRLKDRAIRQELQVENPIGISPNYTSKVFKGQRRVGVSEGIADVSAVTNLASVRGKKVMVKAKRGTRSSGSDVSINMTKKGSNRVTTAHEVGHWIEGRDDRVHDRMVEFLDKRTKGEKAVWLGGDYKRSEISKKDKFLNPYMGKIYSLGGRPPYATEILSMGYENYLYDTVNFIEKDFDHFKFIHGILTGAL